MLMKVVNNNGILPAVMNNMINIVVLQAVMKGSTAARKGLKRGDQVEIHRLLKVNTNYCVFLQSERKGNANYDQILDVNGESFQHVMTLERAVEILTKQTLLQVIAAYYVIHVSMHSHVL